MSNALLVALGQDRETIPYRKHLRPITKSVHSAILLTQILYWWFKNKEKPFYKYKQPLSPKSETETDMQFEERTKYYKEGDSWCEELEFTRAEFDSALANIARQKDSDKEDGEPSIKDCITYYTVRDRRTFYEVNDAELLTVILSNALKSENPALAKVNVSQKRESSSLKSENPALSKAGIQLLNITENTTEITSKMSSKEDKDGPLTGSISGDFKRRVNKEKHPAISEETSLLIEHWNSFINPASKLVTPKYDKYTKIDSEIQSLLNGTHPAYPGVKFRVFDIRQAITRFAKAVQDPEVEPYNKKLIKSISLTTNFFHNPHIVSDQLMYQRPFLYFKDNEPKKLSDKHLAKIDVENPTVQYLVKRFKEMAHLNGNPLSSAQMRDLSFARDKLEKLVPTYKARSTEAKWNYWKGVYEVKEDACMLAFLLCEAIEEDLKKSKQKIHTGWLCSDYAINDRLPEYLKEINAPWKG